MINNWLGLLLLVSILMSCEQQELKQNTVVIDYGYFPLDSGFWREFNVTSIDIDAPSNKYDTLRFQLREEFSSWFLDAANDSAMRIERFYRDSTPHAWKPYGVWQASIQNNEAQQAEENIRFLKIKFPITQDLSWYGDKYNRLDTLQLYQYTASSVDQPYNVNGLAFDSVLTVTQKYKLTLVDKLEFDEKFAYGVGLVSKQEINIYSDDPDASIPIENRVSIGTFYYQDIYAYGSK